MGGNTMGCPGGGRGTGGSCRGGSPGILIGGNKISCPGALEG